MILHIFKKDFRLFWQFAAGVAVLGWLTLILVYRADHFDSDREQVHNLPNLLAMLQMLAGGILAAGVVQADALPGVRQDWLARPIERRDLLLAKLLCVTVLIVVPGFAGSIVEALANGVPAGQALILALQANICLLAIFYLPVMAFASITRNFAENIVAVVGAVAAIMSIGQIINLLLPNWALIKLSGIDWISELATLGIVVLAAAIILLLQYYRRRTTMARWLTAAFGLLCAAVLLIPWQTAFAIQQRLSPHLGGASAVSLSFQPGLGRYREPSRTYANGYSFIRRGNGTAVYLPIGIAGMGAETVLRTELVRARLIAPDGSTVHLPPVVPPQFRNEPAGLYDLLFVPAMQYQNLRDKPVRVELDYSLTLLHLDSAHALPALDASRNVPGFGHCETRLDNAGTLVQLRCMMVPRTPPCMTLFLENSASGKRNPDVVMCRGQYTPYNLQLGPDALRRAIIDLPFRDLTGLLHFPVDGSQLRESQVVMKFYEPVEHFTRHVAIPDVRLSDWLPL